MSFTKREFAAREGAVHVEHFEKLEELYPCPCVGCGLRRELKLKRTCPDCGVEHQCEPLEAAVMLKRGYAQLREQQEKERRKD